MDDETLDKMDFIIPGIKEFVTSGNKPVVPYPDNWDDTDDESSDQLEPFSGNWDIDPFEGRDDGAIHY